MKQYSFKFNSTILKEFKKKLSVSKGRKILKSFLLNEYQLPLNLKDFEKNVEDLVIQPYWMSSKEINKIDLLIKEAAERGYTLNRSAIMRDVMNNLVLNYSDKPISVSEQHEQVFKVFAGTKKNLGKHLEHGELPYELSSFILDGYVPSNEFPSVRNQPLESLHFKTDKEVFDKMDKIAEEYGFKKGGRAKIFRDAINQFERILDKNQPKKQAIKQELKLILNEYKDIEENLVIKEEIEKYLKD